MTKILFIHHAVGWGGAPINMINIINSLDMSSLYVEVLLLKDSIVSEKLYENNIPFKIAESKFYKRFYQYYSHTLPGNTKWYRIIKQIKLMFSWVLSRYYFAPKEIAKHKCDIVHLNSSVLTDWLAPCKAMNKRVLMHIQEPLSPGSIGFRYNFFRSQMKKYADQIITISHDNADRVGLNQKTTTIYNFTNISNTIPSSDSYGSKKVLYLGGAMPIKGFYSLVSALEYIDNDIKIIFAGYYPSKVMRKRLKKFLPKNIIKSESFEILRNSNKAVEVGLVQNVPAILSEVCCLVSPFTVEHFSRPIIEAFANYKPVIATKIEGIEEIVEDKLTGLLVEKNSPEELASAINYLCNNSNIAREMGMKGHTIAKKRFSNLNAKQFNRLYLS